MDEQLLDQIGQTLTDIHELLQTADRKLYELEEAWVKAVREAQDK